MPEWKELKDRQEFPQGLADLIGKAYILVHDGAEYAGIFVHGDDKCWLGYTSKLEHKTISKVFMTVDDAVKEGNTAFRAGFMLPRRKARV